MTNETKSGTQISALPTDAKLSDVISKINELIQSAPAKRDRGPASTKEMSEADAIRVISGDLKDLKHRDAAVKLGLSYGQVYSARLGFTFKKANKENKKS